jgi:hypothetical protein
MRDLFDKAKAAARSDGRLRYIWGDRIHLVPERTGNFIAVGAADWARVENGRWEHHNYMLRPRE